MDRSPVRPSNRGSDVPVLAYVLDDALYLNLTSACTLACVFCPKIRDDEWRVEGYDLKLTVNPSADEVWRAALSKGPLERWVEVVFTGFGEPTRRLEVLLDLVRRLKRAGVRRTRLDTDGLASLREGRDVPPELAAAGLDAISVSLNAPDPATYARLCPSRFGEAAHGAVKDFIASAVRCVPDVAASAVALPGLSEEVCRELADSLGARFRWRPYDRLGRIEGAGSLPPAGAEGDGPRPARPRPV
jgi:TatD DNase family protein